MKIRRGLSLAASLLLLAACHSGSDARPVPDIWSLYDGDRAFADVKTLVDLGPRPAGSAVLDQSRQYIIGEVEKAGWKIKRQVFNDETPRGTIKFCNLIATFGGDQSTQQAIVCSHYDTKLFDTIRFVGASDGGSSTGALIELARTLARDPGLARRVELVFFDGEEALVQFTDTDGLYGSRYYARALRDSGRYKQFKFGILWDMMGPKNLDITLSPDSPPDLTRGILKAADALSLRQDFTIFDREIYDDHVPLLHFAEVPTIDLIDFNYPPWHTAEDTLDKLGPESLKAVGEVTLYYLRTQFPNE
jgi:Zn-dependent M28 family amino/carboxypeptidase